MDMKKRWHCIFKVQIQKEDKVVDPLEPVNWQQSETTWQETTNCD